MCFIGLTINYVFFQRHARSEKLLKENRLKAMLNSDGEIENQETALEMHARIVALAEVCFDLLIFIMF